MTLLDSFFSKNYESPINKNMLLREYNFPYQEVIDYISNINDIPLKEFYNYVLNNKRISQLISKDIFQFSSFADATFNLSQKLSILDNPGIKVFEAGKLLLDDGKERLKGAYIKYGENHLKTAEAIGFMFSLGNTYFLNCIGFVYYKLSKVQRDKILIRLLFRNPFVIFILLSTQDHVLNLKETLTMLSEKTYLRRRSNLKHIINIFLQTSEFDFSFLRKLVIW